MTDLTQSVTDVALTVDDVAGACQRLRAEIERVIYGKRHVVELALIGVLAEGHLLIEDVPGVGKTELAKALARGIGGRFRRIQGTPDLLPMDVTGGHVLDGSSGQSSFRPGPVFADVVLVDELNRAAPKTQSALLQVMQERQVTVDDQTHEIARPFIVVATMNPTGFVGTYDLPGAQLDRFMMSVHIGYPDRRAEALLVEQRPHVADLPSPVHVVTPAELLRMIAVVRDVFVSSPLVDYMVEVVDLTRRHPDLERGASPRATMALAAAVRARAACAGRDYGIADDVKALVPAVLAHRLVPAAQAALEGRTADQTLAGILESVPVPRTRRPYWSDRDR